MALPSECDHRLLTQVTVVTMVSKVAWGEPTLVTAVRTNVCAKCPLLLLGLTKTEMCRHLMKLPSVKCHENALSRSRVVSCVRTDRQTDGSVRLRRSAGLQAGLKRCIE